MSVSGHTSERDANGQGVAIALGNFDGVHRGHQAVIADAAAFARANNAQLGVVTFEPHPRRFFAPDTPPFRLQSAAQRGRALKALGVDVVVAIPFTAELSKMSDLEFAKLWFSEMMPVAHISVGADFRFGRGRSGDVASLSEYGKAAGFSVRGVTPVCGEDGQVYSSTAAREAIAVGDMVRAASILSRPWAIEGEVRKGFQRGREFGVPTANVALGEYVRPRLGVYAVRVNIGDGAWRAGVANVGVNPTVGALPEPQLEAHLFDFDGDLHGRTIETQMIAFLRDEAKFDDVDAMKAQMTTDIANARRLLG